MFFWVLVAVAIFVVPRALDRRRRRRTGAAVPYKYRPMRLLVGSAGTGKSYYLTFQAVKSLAEGRRVLCNFGLRPERVYLALRRRYGLGHRAAMDAVARIEYLETYDDWINAKDCDVYLDEVQDFISGQSWNLIPWVVITKFAQHRHFKLRVTMAAHRFLALHTYVREGLVAEVFVARAPNVLVRIKRAIRTLLVGPPLPQLHYMQVKDESDELTKDVKRRKGLLSRWSSSESVPLDPLVANSYDHIGGVFESPLSIIRRESGKDHGIVLVRELDPHPESFPVDGLPSLSILEVAEHADDPYGRASMLAERWPEDAKDRRRILAA